MRSKQYFKEVYRMEDQTEYAWLVDVDHSDVEFGGGMKDVEIYGPCEISDELKEQLQAGEGEYFKMYDADGNLYYTGRIVGDFEGFEPLDDYGMPNAGAIDIHYKNKNGEFEPL